MAVTMGRNTLKKRGAGGESGEERGRKGKGWVCAMT